MATKQQKLLEETAEKVNSASGAITEIAEKASSAVTGLDSISKGNSDVLDANKAVLKRMNVGFPRSRLPLMKKQAGLKVVILAQLMGLRRKKAMLQE